MAMIYERFETCHALLDVRCDPYLADDDGRLVLVDELSKCIAFCRINLRHRTAIQYLCERMLVSRSRGSVVEYDYSRLIHRTGEVPAHAMEFSRYHKVAAGLIEIDIESFLVDYDDCQLHSEDYSGKTPLHWAAYTANISFLRTLLRARANINAEDHRGRTALHLAAMSGNQRCLELLLIAGSNVLASDSHGLQALHFAALFGSDDKEILDILLMAGADIHSRDLYGATVLQSACNSHKVNQTIALIEAGAQIESQDNDGDTPLFDSISHGHAQAIQMLLSYGASFSHQNKYGHTVLHKLAQYGTLDTIAPFLSLVGLGEVDVEARCKDGRTAWETLQNRPAPPEGF